MGIDGGFRHSAPIFRDPLRRAVRKGHPALLQTVSEGFAAIDPGDLKRINEKWFGRTINQYSRYFTYSSYAAAVAILSILGLAGWNRALKMGITQRTAALRESEQRFREMAENIREVFWMATDFGGPHHSVLYVSPAYEDVWGRTRDSLYRDPRSFIDGICPEDRVRVIEVNERNHGQRFEVEYRVMRPDGSIRWIRDRGFPINDETGRVYRTAGIAEDITERKQAENKLRRSESLLAEAERVAHVGYWERNLDTGEIVWSDETYRIFGLHPQDSIQNFEQWIHPEDRLLQADATARALRGEHDDVLFRVIRPDGHTRLLHSQGQVMRDESGRSRRAFGTVQDVTELKRTEEKLIETSEQLRALAARLQSVREEEGIRIAREIHDELGSALTSLRWDLEMIKDKVPMPDLTAKITAMLELTDATINIVRRIAADLRPSVLDNLGLKDAIAWQAHQFQDRTAIAVHCELPHEDVDLSAQQSTAVFRIYQEALTNILRHAGATRVDVTMMAKDGAVALEIRDNGRGITEDEKSGRSSIGLLGMRERARLIGGEVDVTGVAGKGTTVAVRITGTRG